MIEKKSRRVEYWSCGQDGCDVMHRTIALAEKCIAIKGAKARGRSRRAAQKERFAAIVAARRTGLSLRETGKKFGIQKERVRQVMLQQERMELKAELRSWGISEIRDVVGEVERLLHERPPNP